MWSRRLRSSLRSVSSLWNVLPATGGSGVHLKPSLPRAPSWHLSKLSAHAVAKRDTTYHGIRVTEALRISQRRSWLRVTSRTGIFTRAGRSSKESPRGRSFLCPLALTLGLLQGLLPPHCHLCSKFCMSAIKKKKHSIVQPPQFWLVGSCVHCFRWVADRRPSFFVAAFQRLHLLDEVHPSLHALEVPLVSSIDYPPLLKGSQVCAMRQVLRFFFTGVLCRRGCGTRECFGTYRAHKPGRTYRCFSFHGVRGNPCRGLVILGLLWRSVPEQTAESDQLSCALQQALLKVLSRAQCHARDFARLVALSRDSTLLSLWDTGGNRDVG